jgi:uroporphyrinogen III methyltransferase/synthase
LPSLRHAEPGVVYLVGAGPGDPGLLTVRGADCLRSATVVIYDTLTSPKVLALAPQTATRIPIGKRHGERCLPQESINQLMVDHARQGQIVVRLKGGDPCVFGRCGEEMAALHGAGVRFEIVPGITAGIAAPAYAGIPVTHRDFASAVAFITGHEDPLKPATHLDWPSLAAFPGTLVFYMSVRRLPEVIESLVRHGKPADTPATVIEWGTTPRQRIATGTVCDIAQRAQEVGLTPPAVVVIGRVAEMANAFRWFEELPLFGQRIVVTRAAHQTASTVQRLGALGAEVLELPAIRLEPPRNWEPVDRAIRQMSEYDWVVFTSANGVQSFLRHVADLGLDSRVLGRVRIAAIGAATADALRTGFGLRADLTPAEPNSESLVRSFREMQAPRRLLLLRADEGRDALPIGLEAAGIAFDDVGVYRSVEETDWDPDVIAYLEAGDVDWITVTSPRIVRALARGLPGQAQAHIGHRTRVASISPLTSASAIECGWSVGAEAAHADLDSLVDAIVRCMAGAKPRSP